MRDVFPVRISGAVEGILDEAVAKRLIQHVGAEAGTVYGRNGKSNVLVNLAGYNNSARQQPWLVLVDLDRDAPCAAQFVAEHLRDRAPDMCFRVAVREIEAWLMADAERFSRWLSVSRVRIPPAPDNDADPKRTVVNIARHSRRRGVRDDIVPTAASRRVVGPGYDSQMIAFVSDSENGWRPQVAAGSSPSLGGCLNCLWALVRKR